MKKLLACWMALLLALSGMAIALAEEQAAWTLNVQVTDEQGEAIDGVQVTLKNAAGETVYDGPAANGALETSVSAGAYMVRATDKATGYGAREIINVQEDASVAMTIRTLAEGSSVTVGSLTKVSGQFATDLFGNNTSDIDVRAMLHGYSTVAFTENASYALDASVATVEAAQDDVGNKLYVFHVKDGLTYNDGTPITARDYVFSILLQSSQQMAQIGATSTAYWQLDGYAAYNTGRKAVFSGVRLLDDMTFSMTVRADALPYYYELTYVNVTPYPIGVIAPGCSVADDGDGAYIQGDFTAQLLEKTMLDAQNGYCSHPMVTSGAYCLESYDAQTGTVVMKANANYKGNYDGQRPLIETVTLVHTTNADVLTQLNDGTMDIANKITDSEVIAGGVAQQEEGTLMASNYLRSGLGFLSFACEQGPTSLQDVRQAIGYCLDLDTLVAAFTGVYGRPVYSWYGLGQWMAADYVNEADEKLNTYAVDPDAAAALLKRAGYNLNAEGKTYEPTIDTVRYMELKGRALNAYRAMENPVVRAVEAGGKTLLPLTLRIASVENNRVCTLIEEILVPQLQITGFEVEMVPMTFGEMMAQYYREETRTCNVYPLATNFTYVFDPLYTWNGEEQYQGYLNTTGIDSDNLVNKASRLRATAPGNDETYLERWKQLMEAFNEELPVLPLYSNTYFDFYAGRIQNYAVNAHWSWPAAILYAWTEAAE